MIHHIYSSLPPFKNLKFHPGLNVLLAEKKLNANHRQTRNRAGKSSLIEIVHYLTGAKREDKSLFNAPELEDVTFGMEFDLSGEYTVIERQNKKNASFILNDSRITAKEWKAKLGHKMFGLKEDEETEGRVPTFRSLFSYFARRISSGAFLKPEKNANEQCIDDYQISLMYLFGLDWKIAADWEIIRDREKTFEKLRTAVKKGAFGSIIGNSAELRTQVTVKTNELMHLKQQVESFRVHPKYRELEKEANELTHKLNELANANTIDLASVRDLKAALESEAPPQVIDLDAVYEEAGIILPDLVKKRYREVQAFHESVMRNRKDYLGEELKNTQLRIEARDREKVKLDERRSEVMEILKSHGALDQFTRLQEEAGRLESQVETLRSRLEAAETLEGEKRELEIERNRLLLRLHLDFKEQKSRLEQSILAYQEISKQLYENAGSIYIDETSNGPIFRFEIQGSRSVGINKMQIFCFDMMLMRLCKQSGIGPGFLIHDSHLFDGVDGRQIIRALKIGAETAEELGFQYIVTMNEDDAFKEEEFGFDLHDYVLPVKLTDATEDGGLFGIRFD